MREMKYTHIQYVLLVKAPSGEWVRRVFDSAEERDEWIARRRPFIVGDPRLHEESLTIVGRSDGATKPVDVVSRPDDVFYARLPLDVTA